MYCLVHAAACHAYPEDVPDFGVALEWQRLSVLRLSNKLANDALLRICNYLRLRTRPGLELFVQQGPTLDLALRVARENPGLQQLLQFHQAASAAREQGHWAEVQRKQKLAAQLLETVNQLNEELQGLQKELTDAENDKNCFSLSQRKGPTWRAACDLVSTLTQKARSKEAEVSSAEGRRQDALKPPEQVIHPLPESESAAYQVQYSCAQTALLL